MGEYITREEFEKEINQIYSHINDLTGALTKGLETVGERLSKNEAAITNAFSGMTSMLEMIQTLAKKT